MSEQDEFDKKKNFNESRIISATMEEDTDFLDRYENLDDEDHEGDADAATNFTKPKDDPEIMDFINEVDMKMKGKFNNKSVHDSNTATNLEFENKKSLDQIKIKEEEVVARPELVSQPAPVLPGLTLLPPTNVNEEPINAQ